MRSVGGRSSGQPDGGKIPELAMKTGSNCGCLICRLERSLTAELGAETASHEWVYLASSSAVLSRFANPLDFVGELHAPEGDGALADTLLIESLKHNENVPVPSVWQRILLLVFIPTIHRTASHMRVLFPAIARDDASQHVLAVFLEFLGSSELRARRSHVAFTIARKLRRQAFRWAIRETRGILPEGSRREAVEEVDNVAAEEPLYAEVVLERFLDNCQTMGWLSTEERELLVRFKLDGVTGREIAGRNGNAAAAVRHRIQRLLDRLRRLANRTQWTKSPEQLELFPPRSHVASTTKKIFC